MSRAFEISKLNWQPIRPEVAHGVVGKTLLDSETKVVLVRVAPGGNFCTHQDGYAHLFYFLSGTGTVTVDGKEHLAQEGLVVQVTAGEAHAYVNTGTDELVLISINLPLGQV